MRPHMPETGREQRLARRIDQLYASDPQFRAAAPFAEVTEAAHASGRRLWQVVDEYLTGYADRPALGQRCCEVRHDATTGRTTTALLSGFETITYRELRDRAAALSTAWQSDLPGGFAPGDFIAVLGFTSIDYATVYLTCLRLGAVFVPLQTSSTAAQLAPIIAETEPRIFAVSLESLDVAVDVLIDGPSVQRLVVFDYTSDDDEQRERFQSASERLAAAGNAIEVVPLSEDLRRPAGRAGRPGIRPARRRKSAGHFDLHVRQHRRPQGRDVHHRHGDPAVAASAQPVTGHRQTDSRDPPAVHAAVPRLRAGMADRHARLRRHRIFRCQKRHVHPVRRHRAGSPHRAEPGSTSVRHDLPALPQRTGSAAQRLAPAKWR